MGAHRNFSKEKQGTDDMASAGARAYKEGLGRSPGAEPLVSNKLQVECVRYPKFPKGWLIKFNFNRIKSATLSLCGNVHRQSYDHSPSNGP